MNTPANHRVAIAILCCLSAAAASLAGCSISLSTVTYDGFARVRALAADESTPHTRVDIEALTGPAHDERPGPAGVTIARYAALMLRRTFIAEPIYAQIDRTSLGTGELLCTPIELGRIALNWSREFMEVRYDRDGVATREQIPCPADTVLEYHIETFGPDKPALSATEYEIRDAVKETGSSFNGPDSHSLTAASAARSARQLGPAPAPSREGPSSRGRTSACPPAGNR